MPTYEYRCTACEHQFEKFQRMSDPPGAECPKCSAASERKLSGGAGLLFKGSGFYITDYRNDSYKKAAKAEDGGSAPAAGAEKSSSSSSSPSSSSSASSSEPKSKPTTKSE